MADINVKVKVDSSELDNLEKRLGKNGTEVGLTVSGQEDLKRTTAGIQNMTTAAQKSNGVFATLKGKIAETFSSAKIATTAYLAVLFGLQKAGSAAVKSIEAIDSAIVDLQIATNGTYEDTKKLVASYNSLGQGIGATTTQVTSAADDWLRSGRTISEANKLIQDSLMLSKLGKIDSSEATSDLLAITNAYELEVDEIENVVDKLTAVDMATAADAGGLATSINKTAEAASLAGVDFNKLVGYIATVKNQTQQADEIIGNAFKSIFSRMNKVKAGADVDDLGESLNDVERVLGDINVALRDANGNWYDSDKVLDDVALKWDSLSDTMQRKVATALGGTYQYNNAIALLDNYGDSLKYTEVAANSAGTALDKYNNSYLNSIEAKKNQLQASFESLIFNTDAQEVYKSILDITSSIVQLADKANLLKGAFAGLLTAGVIKGFTSLKTGIMGAYVELNNFNNALKLSKQTSISTDGFNQLLSLTKNLSDSQTKLILSSANLSQQQKINILTNQGLSEAEAVTRLNTLGLSDANRSAEKSTKSLSNAMGGFLNTIKANPVGAITAAVTAAVMVYNLLKKVVDEHTINIEEAQDATDAMIDSFQSAKSEAEENAETIKDIKNEYASLMKEVNQYTNANLSLSTEDYERYLELTNQIAEIFPDLVKGYDSEGNAILNLAGDINTLVDAYEKAQKAAYALAFTGSDDIENSGFKSVVKSYLSETSKTGSWWDNFWKKFGHKFTNQRDVGIDLSYQEAIEELQTFINANEEDIIMSRNMDLHVIADSLGVTYGDVFNATGEALQRLQNQAQTVVNTYQETMDSALSDIQTAAEGYLKGLNSTYDDLSEEQQNLASVIVSNMPKDVADTIANSTNSEQALRNWVSDIVELIQNSGDDITGIYENITESLSDTSKLNTEGLDQITAQIEELSNLTGISVDDYKDIFGIDELYKSLNTKVQSVKTIARDLNIDLVDILGDDETQKPSLIDLSQLKEEAGEFDSIANTYVSTWGQLQDAMSAYQIGKDSIITNNEFLSQVDTYITKTNELSDALTDYKNGDFSNSDVNELIKKFPELEGHADDLDSAIIDLMGSMDTDMVNKFGEQFGKIDSAEDRDELYKFMDAVLALGNTVGATQFSIDIDAETESMENLYSAIEESTSATGLSSESITNLKERYQDLENYDAAGLFEKTANGIHLNTKELRELEAEYKKQIKSDADTSLKDLKNEYDSLTQQINTCSDATRRADLYAQRDDILTQIQDTATLAAQYEGLTSKYNAYLHAIESTNERDMYETIISGYDEVKETLSHGWVDDDVRSYVDLMTYTDMSTASTKELEEAWSHLGDTIKGTDFSALDFFTYDDDGNSTSQGVQNFWKALNQINKEWAWQDDEGFHIDLGIGGDDEVAEKLGISTEALQSLMRAASEASDMDIHLDSAYSEYDHLKTSAEECNDALNNVLTSLGQDGFTFNVNTTDADDLKEQISAITGIIDENFRNEEGSIDLSIDGAEEAKTILEALYLQKQNLEASTVMSIDTTGMEGDIYDAVELLQDFEEKYAGYEVDTYLNVDTQEAQTNIQNYLTNLSQLPSDVRAKLGLDDEEFKTALATLTAQPVDVEAGVTLDEEALGVVLARIAEISPDMVVEAGVDPSLVDGYDPDNKDSTVVYGVDHSAVDTWRATLTDEHKKIYYTPVVTSAVSSLISKVTGGGSKPSNANGTIHAHANGTVTPAHASGTDISIKQNQVSDGTLWEAQTAL